MMSEARDVEVMADRVEEPGAAEEVRAAWLGLIRLVAREAIRRAEAGGSVAGVIAEPDGNCLVVARTRSRTRDQPRDQGMT